MRKIFSRISPKLPEEFLGNLLCDIHVILGAIFARIFMEFARIFRDFSKIFTNFAQISTDFARIFRDFARIFTKSKHLGVRFQPLHPRLLHHWKRSITHAIVGFTLASGWIRGFSGKKTPKRTWLCAGISPLLFGLRTWSSVKRRGKSSSLHLKKNFLLRGAGFL